MGMSRLLLMICLSVFTFQVHAKQTDYNIVIPSSGCTFFYSGSGASFSFKYCSNRSSLIHSWLPCLENCCDTLPPVYGTPTLDVLKVCRGESNSEDAIVIVVLAAIFGGTLLAVTLVYLCRIFIDFKSNRVTVIEAEEIEDVEWLEQKDINKHLCKEQEWKWSSLARLESKLKNKQEACSICLDQGTNTELFCGHQYHPRCIGAWLKKNTCCPYCRMANIQGAKVYCLTCRWRYMVCTKTVLMAWQTNKIPSECRSCFNSDLTVQALPQSSEVLINFDKSYQTLIKREEYHSTAYQIQ